MWRRHAAHVFVCWRPDWPQLNRFADGLSPRSLAVFAVSTCRPRWAGGPSAESFDRSSPRHL